MSQEIYECSGAVFRLPNGDLVLQQRDDKPGINSPGMVHIFGGSSNPGESHRQTLERELKEETGLEKEKIQNARYVGTFDEEGAIPPGIHRDRIFEVPIQSAQELKVLEGAGHVVITRETDITKLPLTDVARRVLAHLGRIEE